MRKQFKALSFLLVLIMCVTAFAGCNGNGDESSAAMSSNAGTSGEKFSYGPADYGEFPYADKNYENSDPIRILCVETARQKFGEQQFVYIEEMEGNTINSAVQKRNNFIEEQYGITFEITPVKYPNEEIAILVQSGTDEYDLICESVDRLVVGIPDGFYRSLDDYMDFSHPWWDAQAIETLALGSQHYFVAGDAILTDDDNTYLTLFNKDMYGKNSALSEKGDIYDIVRAGEFTIDLYYEMCREVSHTDENGQWGFNATYGNLSHAYGATVMVNGCNIATVEKNADNELFINVDSEAAITAFDKVYSLMSDANNTQRAELIIGQSASNSSAYGFAELEEMFVNGRGLFYNTTSSSVSILKSANMDFEFGVLPIPKLNKEQENYCCTVNRYHSSALAIPATVPSSRIDQVVFAMQALGFYNADTIRAYYQTTLQLQAVQSDDDAEMLDIVYNNRFYDIGAIYGWGGLESIYGSVIGNSGANTLVSTWQSMETAVETAMQKSIDDYNKAA